MKINIYIEGGGEGKDLHIALRRAFQKFFISAGFKGKLPRVYRCGSRNDALRDFCTALSQASPHEFPMLLVDSEDPVTPGLPPWHHLKNRDGWSVPDQATNDHVHLMTQCMETWFLADPDALARYYDPGFHANALPKQKNIEDLSKVTIMKCLNAATETTKTKGRYHKGRHSFDILERIDPTLVQTLSPWACRFLRILDEKIGGQSTRGCPEPHFR
ncbi:MAG: DUF4276 family protein [Magnetococcales bacterium]|nr:DUF4276 family protein [Magnetococcales bacterium]